MSRNTPLLDLQEPPSREERIGRLLESLNSQPPASSTTAHPLRSILPLSPQINELLPSPDLLSRVKAFLPLIQASNDALRRQMETNPSSVDMEVLDGTEDAYIEMDLGLGVFEQRGSRQPNASSSFASSSEDSESEDSSSDDDGSDSGSDQQKSVLGVDGRSTMPDIISLLTAARPTRPLPHRRRQKADIEPVKEPGMVVAVSSGSDEGH